MIAYEDIKLVHLEISTLCNAMCPLCPRNFNGYPYNDGYPEVNFTLDNAHKIFSKEFLSQLTQMHINGNYGDIVMNPEAVDIVRYFKSSNPRMAVTISTNGGARDKNFWTQLAQIGAEVTFCLDGLAGAHELYRQNTSWDTVVKNAKTFIAAGGAAHWKFIKFNHNIHQLDECKQLSQQMGFKSFIAEDHGRNLGPVFNKRGEYTHAIGNYTGPTEFAVLFHKKKTDAVMLEDIIDVRRPKKVACRVQRSKSIYISANGEVYPCCWTGFYPRTFGHGEYHQAVNEQIAPLISANNALVTPLKDCISWFSKVEQSWAIPEYKQGRLVACDDVCGT